MADKTPAPAPKPTLNLSEMARVRGKDGKDVYVLPESKLDYLMQGYTDPVLDEADAAPEGSAGKDWAMNDTVRGTAEAFLRGKSLGASGPIADVIEGGANLLAQSGGYQGPRATGPGIDAPLAEEPTFMGEMGKAAAERQARAEKMGLVGTALEMAGGFTPASALSKEASVLSKVMPSTVLEKFGTRQATKLIGDSALATAASSTGKIIGKTLLGRAVGGGLEGGIGSGVATASEKVDQLQSDPVGAVQDIAIATGLGTVLGATTGGVLGSVEGAMSASKIAAKTAAEKAAARTVVPARQVVDALQEGQELELRSGALSHTLPEPPRTWFEKVKAQYASGTGGLEEAEQAGARQLEANTTRMARIDAELREGEGMASKRAFNDKVLNEHIANDLVDEIPTEDAAIIGQREAAQAAARAEMDAVTQAAAESKRLAAEAQDAHRAIQTELDAASVPAFKASKEARQLMRERGYANLGTNEQAPAMERLAAEIAELESGLAQPARLEYPDVVRTTTKFNQPYFEARRPGAAATDKADGWARGSLENDPELFTVELIATPDNMRGKGMGTKLYSDMADFAESKGRRLASDISDAQSPEAERWWQKRVAEGKAEFNAEKDRFILTGKLGDTAPAVKGSPERMARELANLKEIQQQLSVPARKADATALGARLTEASARLRETTKGDAVLTARMKAAQAALDKAEAMEIPPARKMTRMESEARGMFDGTINAAKKQAEQASGGEEQQAALRLVNKLEFVKGQTIESFKKGDFGQAYHQIDRGTKDALDDFIRGSKTESNRQFGIQMYSAPQQYLERADIHGVVGELQAKVNPLIHEDMLAKNDVNVKSLFGDSGSLSASGYGPDKKALSGAVSGLVKSLNDQAGDGTQLAYKKYLAKATKAAAGRADAWGDQNAKRLADEMAALAKQNVDILDNVSRKKIDAGDHANRLKKGQFLSSIVSAAGALSGMPGVALPAIGARWLMNSLGQQRTDVVGMLARGANKLVTGSGKAAAEVARTAPRIIMGEKARQEAINDARDMAMGQGPKFAKALEAAEVLEDHIPGMGEAALKNELQKAELILQHAPQPPSDAMFSPPAKLPPSQAVYLDRLFAATAAPKKAFDRILSGQANNADLDAMRQLYPVPYQKMVDNILAEIDANPSAVKGHAKRLYLSRVTGVALTPALADIIKTQERAAIATQGKADESKTQDGGDGMTAKAPISIDADAIYGSRADQVMATG